MSSFEYTQHSLDERAELVFKDGRFAADMAEYYNRKAVLYSLHDFWVEIFYNLYDDMIEDIRLAEPAEIEKYLNRIKIDLF